MVVLTQSEFVEWLQIQRDAGYTHAAIGEKLGVTHEAVRGWLAGRINPSKTVLILATRLPGERITPRKRGLNHSD